MMKIFQYIFIVLFLLNINACKNSGKAATGAVIGGAVGGPIGAIVGASMGSDQPIEFNEIKQNEVLKIEFKDREFIESQITDTRKIQRIVSQIKQSFVVDPVQGSFYRTVELVLTDDRVVRIGVYDSYLKNGNTYYQMEKELNEEIKRHF